MALSDNEINKVASEAGKTAHKFLDFAAALQKVKAGSEADVNIELTRDDCVALIWGFHLLRQGPSDG